MSMVARFCRKCGVSLIPDSQFCPSCGTAQHTSDHVATSRPSSQPREMHTGRMPAGSMLHARYRLLHTLGQGGMGAVYIAQDTQLGDRFVALKEMSMSRVPPQDLPHAIEQFKQEAHMLASLHHPNLPVIYDHFSEKDRWYLVMSFIEGETLQTHLNTAPNHKLPVSEVTRIGIELCDVLDYLHTHQPQIIFRDLKPLNIMITPKGQIYLIDFGIARHFKQEQSKDTAYYYSVGYAPPEQYGKSQTGPRSDIYSLGVTLHQMLTGHNPTSKPFYFTSLQLDPQIPTPLATLIAHMLEMNEQNRPSSMQAVKATLEQVLTPVILEPKPVTEQASIPLTVAAKPAAEQAPISPTILPSPVAEQVLTPLSSLVTQSDPSPSAVIPANSVPFPVKPAIIRAFGKKQLITMLLLATFYGITSFIVFLLNSGFLDFSIFRDYPLLVYEVPVYLLPIFFAVVLGSWVGSGATAIGSIVAWIIDGMWYSAKHPGDSLLFFYTGDLIGWWGGAFLTLAAFLVGLILLKTKGQYNQWKHVLLAWEAGVLAIWLAFTMVLAIVIDGRSLFKQIYFSDLWPFIIPSMLFLPILLLASHTARQIWNESKIQPQP